MRYRKIGNLDASPVGLGCMRFLMHTGLQLKKTRSYKNNKISYDMGYNFFDTAECYTGLNADGTTSYNEELVGEALKSVRDNAVIATKFGVQHAPDKSLILDSSPETIRKSLKAV